MQKLETLSLKAILLYVSTAGLHHSDCKGEWVLWY